MASSRWYPSIGQEVIEEVLPIGLRISVLPKPGFQTRFASFTTKYGGMDNVFSAGADVPFSVVPAGIAHFLEHKMFEQPDGTNILDVYSRMGVDANASTYKNRTVYLFSVSDEQRFPQALDILIDYVLTPFFTDENVAKEQGIIQQEIAAGLDRPTTVAWQNFESAMYHEHPAGTSIIGTAESVGQITKEHLFACHDTFYHPSNMLVTVSGDVDAGAVVEAVRRGIAEKGFDPDRPSTSKILRPTFDEPSGVREAFVSKRMKVSRPIVLMGYKGPVLRDSTQALSMSKQAIQVRRLLGSLVCDTLFGRTTQWYWDLYSQGILTRDFSYGFTDYTSACHLLVYGETENKDRLIDEISLGFSRARKGKISPDDFEMSRRSAIGRLLSSVDSPEELALRFIGDAVDGLDALEAKETLESLTAEDADEFLESFIDDTRRVVSCIEPL